MKATISGWRSQQAEEADDRRQEQQRRDLVEDGLGDPGCDGDLLSASWRFAPSERNRKAPPYAESRALPAPVPLRIAGRWTARSTSCGTMSRPASRKRSTCTATPTRWRPGCGWCAAELTRSKLYHRIKWQLPEGAALSPCAPLADDPAGWPKFKGLEAGALRWLKSSAG